MDTQIAALRSEFEVEEKKLSRIKGEEALMYEASDKSRTDMARLRKADILPEEKAKEVAWMKKE